MKVEVAAAAEEEGKEGEPGWETHRIDLKGMDIEVSNHSDTDPYLTAPLFPRQSLQELDSSSLHPALFCTILPIAARHKLKPLIEDTLIPWAFEVTPTQIP